MRRILIERIGLSKQDGVRAVDMDQKLVQLVSPWIIRGVFAAAALGPKTSWLVHGTVLLRKFGVGIDEACGAELVSHKYLNYNVFLK